MKPAEIVGNTFSKLKKQRKKRKLSKKALIITLAILAAAVIFAAVLMFKSKSDSKADSKSYSTAYAEVGDVTETIEQSGTVEPYERREITSLAKGEIIASYYEEGDYVEEGETLYRIDDEDAQLSIEKAGLNLESAENDIKNLYI